MVALGCPPPSNYTLTVQTQGNGSVDPSGGTYESGTTVTLTATPDANWLFDHWEDDLAGSAHPSDIVMDTDKLVTAVFVAETQYTLTTSVDAGRGSVTLDPQQA